MRKIPRKALFAIAGFLVSLATAFVRAKYPDAPLPSNTEILAATGILIAGHTATDIAALRSGETEDTRR